MGTSSTDTANLQNIINKIAATAINDLAPPYDTIDFNNQILENVGAAVLSNQVPDLGTVATVVTASVSAGITAAFGDLSISTNVLSSINTNEDIIFDPNGTGKIDLKAPTT